MSIVKYKHHEHDVYVKKEYKGKHNDICLCIDCKHSNFTDHESSCPLSAMLYAFCREHGGTAIRSECPRYESK